MKALVATELERIPVPACREQVARRLVEPSFVALDWEYGAIGATRTCCVVARLEDGDQAVVYCEEGFSPRESWGAVLLSEASMGSDDQWYTSLYDAAIATGLCTAPPGYEAS
jgi:hypothetical protein